jgi:hypothetical protein
MIIRERVAVADAYILNLDIKGEWPVSRSPLYITGKHSP